jgi:hypothetical protein
MENIAHDKTNSQYSCELFLFFQNDYSIKISGDLNTSCSKIE